MIGSLQATRDVTSRFFSWWGAELAELVPQRVRQLALRETGRMILSAEDGQFVVYEEAHGKLIHRGPISPKTLRTDGRSDLPIGIRLPRSAYLVRHLQLPAAARRDFDRILKLDLERATPFRQNDIYSDYVIDSRADHDGKVAVQQVVVKRQVLDPLLEELSSTGIKVDFADCWDDDKKQRLPINLIKSQRAELATTSYARLALILAAGIAILACSAILIGLNQYESALRQLEAETESARARALTVNRSLSEIDAALTEVTALRRLRAARPPMIRILDELTRLLPDSTWVNHLRIEGDTVEVTIVAQATDALLPLLAGSPMFATAELAAPVTFDRSGQSERVTVRMTLRPMTPAAQGPGDHKSKG
jgi:general secretion pathway protein L